MTIMGRNMQVKSRKMLVRSFRGWIILICIIICCWSCASIQQELRDIQKRQALKKIKQGEISGDVYTNNYYKCRMSFNSDFLARLNYPKSLLVLNYKDNISEIELFVRETLDVDEIIDEFSKREPYQKTREKNIELNGLNGKEVIYNHFLKKELMTSLVCFLTSGRFTYIIKCSTLAPLFDGLYDTMRRAMNTFTVIGGISVAKKNTRKEKITLSTKEVDTSPVRSKEKKKVSSFEIRRKEIDGAFIMHQVNKGESLAIIAKQYTGSYGNWKELCGFNQIEEPNDIQVGQTIKVPKKLLLPTKKVTGPKQTLLTHGTISKNESILKPKKIKKTDYKIFKHNIADVWKVAFEIFKTDNVPIKYKNKEKYFLMTTFIDKNQYYRYRYTLKLDSQNSETTKVKVVSSMQKKTKDSWDNPIGINGKEVWLIENLFYNKLESFLGKKDKPDDVP